MNAPAVPPEPLDPRVAALAREAPPRVWSFLVTLFGDAIVPRGGTVDSATVQRVTGRLGIEPGTVRVAFSRLARDGWIERRRSGRGSLYSLSARGHAPFEAAGRRIYAAPEAARDGRPRLVAIGDPAAGDPPPLGARAPRAAVEGTDALELGERLWLLVDRGPAHRAALGDAGWLVAPAPSGPPPEWLSRRLGLPALADDLARLVDRFSPLEAAPPAAPLDALLARLLLVHEWRRTLLHVPALPPGLEPPRWPLGAARARVGSLYRRLLPGSSAWLDAHGRGARGPLPPDGPEVAARFGGSGRAAVPPGA